MGADRVTSPFTCIGKHCLCRMHLTLLGSGGGTSDAPARSPAGGDGKVLTPHRASGSAACGLEGRQLGRIRIWEFSRGVRGDKTRADGLTAAAGLWTPSPRASARVGRRHCLRSDSGRQRLIARY